MIRKALLFWGFFLIAAVNISWAQQNDTQSDSTKADSTKSKENAYRKIVDHADKQAKGLMNIYYKDEKLYLEVPFSLLGRDMLLASTISEISDNKLGTVGAKPNSPLWIQFTKVDSVLLLQKMQQQAIAPKDNPNIQKAIQQNSIGPIIQKFDIKAFSEDTTSAIIDVTNYFLSDEKSLSPFGSIGMNISPGVSHQTSFQRGRSFIGNFKSFEDNLTIKSHLSYEYTLKRDNHYIVKNEPFTAVMTRTLLLLPEKKMRPRIADPRIGIFTMTKNEYAENADKVESVHYARRFELVPKDTDAYENGELTEPKSPIIFYMDSDFPDKWRVAIKQAITDWNDAFEKIGFKNAIVACDYPENDPEFDPDNLKYNVVRYSPTPVQNAMGPSWIDPRTGEVLNASVYVYHNIVKLINNWRFIQTAPADELVRSVALPEEEKLDGLRYVIRHEIGHTLGFMHNMAGSYGIPIDSLRSPSFTQKYGTTYSIMDYARFNYVAQPGDKTRGVKLTPPKFGPYDEYLVKWNYTYFPEDQSPQEVKEKLRKLVDEKMGDVRYRYGRQGETIDPSSEMEDLGNDHIKAAKYGIRNLKYVMNHLNGWVGEEDADFSYRESIWNGMVMQYVRYIDHVYQDVGGIFLNQKFEGDPVPQYRSVSRAKQQSALEFLLSQLNDLDWLENSNVIQNLPLTGDASSALHQAITKAVLRAPQKVYLSALKSREKNPYKPRDAMQDIYRFVWEKTMHNAAINKDERALQKAFVKSIIKESGLSEGKSENVAAFSANIFHGIEMPDFVREKGVSEYGKGLYDQFLSTDQNETPAEISASFGGTDLHFMMKPSLESMNYAYLTKVKSLLEKSLKKTHDTATNMHYELLLRKIKSLLN